MNGFELWRGNSAIDGKPIVCIATGLNKSRNVKTGDMVQTWILRQDISPTDAAHSGDDYSICGNCPHRGRIVDGRNVARSCYVILFQAPTAIYRAWKHGAGYERLSLTESADLLADRHVRLGAYGDPAAMPMKYGKGRLQRHHERQATHINGGGADKRFASICMASADSAQEAQEAQAMGYRTFRIGTRAESVARGEFLCPASAEAGKVLTCNDCMACGGMSAKNKASVFIFAHGRGMANIAERESV